MNNKLTVIAASLLVAFSAPLFADQAEDIASLKEQVRELQKKAGGNNLKFSADYRVTMDSIEYKMADGTTAKNDGLLSNRLEIGMGYQPFDNLVFHGLLSYNKAYGESLGETGMGDFDWVTNENLSDNGLNVKEVYMLYLGDQFFGNEQIPWTASLGRRPSTNGFIANNREGYDQPKSPLGHSINVEFDGLSISAKLDQITGVSGMDAKICAGRGLSSATFPRFSSTGTDYADSDGGIDNIDMIGFIVTPYNNGQYDIKAQYYFANNMIGYDKDNTAAGFQDFGNLQNMTLSMQVNGVGEFINDFLDDTVLFASASASQTLPKDGMAMLGSTDKEIGYSYWVGATFPAFFEGDRFGLEYNHGSKYWRSFTYGEDTLIGSKIAARGDAYEAYYNIPIIGESLYFQLRYTYINYDYTGSNGFFGSASGTPTAMADIASGYGGYYVESAQDLRAMIRYNY
ncbi:MAG: hypothetical protein ACJAZP_002928 [Psychromonas sp.]|jgi:hypothetical protein|uniref:DUF3373 family protein n=1 Tax=Psychromonas sp. TaxID=1884585 RepID=UPI0039E4F301